MKVPHSWASRLAVAAVGLLAVLQLAWVVTSDDRTVITAVTPIGLLTTLVTLKMARDNCFESRLGAVVLSSVHVGAVLLATTLGLPGHERHPMDARAATLLVAAGAVLVLIALDHAVRRPRGGIPRTYAS